MVPGAAISKPQKMQLKKPDFTPIEIGGKENVNLEDYGLLE
jgi:hypothetical protein